MHRLYRRRRPRVGTHLSYKTSRRGYSLVELGVSMIIFSIIAGIVTVAVGRSQLTLADNKFSRLIEGRLSGLVEEVSTGAYGDIINGTFSKPRDPGCPEDEPESCVMLGTRDFAVQWTVTPSCLFNCLNGGDLLASSVVNFSEISQQTPYAVTLKASVDLPDGTLVTYSKLLINPSIGADGYGLVRVNFSGNNYSGPIYLVSSERVVLSGGTVTNNIALLSGLAQTCSEATPCSLALNSAGSTREGAVTLDYDSSVGPKSEIVLNTNNVTEISATIISVMPVTALLTGVNADGRVGYAADLNSICQGLRVPVAGDYFIAPSCNSVQSNFIEWYSYFPTGNPLVELAIPINAPLSVVSLSSVPDCQTLPNQTVYYQGSWIPATETCGNYSWGDPNVLRYPMSTQTENPLGTTFYREHVSSTNMELVWDGTLAESNASGAPSGQVWGSPNVSCSDCERISLPVLEGPRVGKYKTLTKFVQPGESFFLETVFNNVDNSSYTFDVKVTYAPYGLFYPQDPDCTLNCQGQSVEVNDMIVTNGGLSENVTFEFIADSSFESDYIEFEISNSEGAHRTKVNLLRTGDDNSPVEIIAGPIVAEQTGGYSSVILVTGTYGEGVTGIANEITIDEDSNMVTVSSVEEIGQGWYAIRGSALSVTSGVYQYAVNVGTLQSSGVLQISPKVGSVSVSDVLLTQNGSAEVTLSITDEAGWPMSGSNTWIDVRTEADENVIGVYPVLRGCNTGQDGTCVLTLTAESTVRAGNYIIQAYAKDKSAQAALSVTSIVSSITYPSVSLSKGESGGVRVRVLDARKDPVAGVTLSNQTLNTGITLTSSVSDSEGYANLSIYTSESTPTGINNLTLGYLEGTVSFVVSVLNVPSRIVISPIVLAQGTSVLVPVNVYDSDNEPVAGAVVNTEAEDLVSSTNVRTNIEGIATIAVSAGATISTGVRYITVTSADGVTAKVSVRIRAGARAVTASGVVTAGLVSNVTWTIYSGSGAYMGQAEYSIVKIDPNLTLSSYSGTTNANGSTTLSVSPSSNIVKGPYNVVFSIDGKDVVSRITVN